MEGRPLLSYAQFDLISWENPPHGNEHQIYIRGNELAAKVFRLLASSSWPNGDEISFNSSPTATFLGANLISHLTCLLTVFSSIFLTEHCASTEVQASLSNIGGLKACSFLICTVSYFITVFSINILLPFPFRFCQNPLHSGSLSLRAAEELIIWKDEF